MEILIPLLFALGVGFTHAFEADHLIAISNIVTHRSRTRLAIVDGIYWGLGHSTTILIIGLVIILGKLMINEGFFGYLEGLVGLLLIVLGISKIRKLLQTNSLAHQGAHHGHSVAYGVGLIHGLAGSGAVILLAMAKASNVTSEIFYLMAFGAGSIVGMLLAAGIFSLPFAQRLSGIRYLQSGMTLLSSTLCIGYGGFILYGIF